MKLGPGFASLVAVALVGALVFAALLAAVDGGSQFAMDGTAFDAVDNVRTVALTSVVKVLTDLGTAPAVGLVVLATCVFLARRRRWLELVPLAAGAVLTVGAVSAVKALEARPRPAGGLVATDSFSFPSGHAAYSVGYVAVAFALALGVPRRAGRVGLVVAAIAVAAAIGMSRVYLGVHYLSDVLGGWALATALFSVCGCAALLVAAVRHNVRAA